MTTLFRHLGALRIALAFFTFVVASMAPFSGLETTYHDIALFPAVIAPVMAILLFFGLLLDMLMGGVFMSEAGARAKYKTVLLADALLLLILLFSWGPFYLSILGSR